MNVDKIGVLLLNQNYQPLNICKLRRAIVLLLKEKAEVVEWDSCLINTVSTKIEVPSVIRLCYFVKVPVPKIQPTRRNILIRDNFVCQYCGIKTHDLTIDHLIPRKFGGKSTWENLVSACKECNNKKGDKLLSETKIKLKNEPRPLKFIPTIFYSDKSLNNFYIKDEWKKYLT